MQYGKWQVVIRKKKIRVIKSFSKKSDARLWADKTEAQIEVGTFLEVKRKAEQLLERERQANERLSKSREPSLKKYVSWVNPNTIGNYWNSIQDYENSKNKKPFKGYY